MEPFQNDPYLNIRTTACIVEIYPSTVHRILWDCLFLFPDKLQNRQATIESDWGRRLKPAEQCSSHRDRFTEYLSKICFSDECIFRMSGVVSEKHMRISGTERPDEHGLVVQNSYGAMKWCTILKERFIGSKVFENANVIAEMYRQMSVHYAFPGFRLLQ